MNILEVKTNNKMEVRFFKIKSSRNVNEVGHYPQTVSFLSDYDKEGADSAYNIRWNEIPSFTPNLNGILIHKNSKITDVVSFFLARTYPLLSDKVVRIVEKFVLPPHKKTKAHLVLEENILMYNLLLFNSKAISSLLLEKCVFSVRDSMTLKEEKVFTVTTISELKTITTECIINNKDVVKKSVVFSNSLLQYDLFNLDFLDGTHISEPLGNELLRQNISGVELTPVSYQVEI